MQKHTLSRRFILSLKYQSMKYPLPFPLSASHFTKSSVSYQWQMRLKISSRLSLLRCSRNNPYVTFRFPPFMFSIITMDCIRTILDMILPYIRYNNYIRQGLYWWNFSILRLLVIKCYTCHWNNIAANLISYAYACNLNNICQAIFDFIHLCTSRNMLILLHYAFFFISHVTTNRVWHYDVNSDMRIQCNTSIYCI